MNTNQSSPTNHQGAYSSPEEQALAYFQQGYQAHMQGNIQIAMAMYKRSLAVHPTAEAHTFLGWALSHKGDLDRAIAECTEAIALDPEYGNPYNDMGAYKMEQGLLDEAEELFHRALKAQRYETPFFSLFNLGRLNQRRGKWFEAIEYYRRAYESATERGVEYEIALVAQTLLQAALN
jgi:tetratricopeptide (TPR) repeat protein